MKIKDITDQYTTESLKPNYPWIFNRTLEFIDIDFTCDGGDNDDYVDYFEQFDSRLKNEIPNWDKLKALKKNEVSLIFIIEFNYYFYFF